MIIFYHMLFEAWVARRSANSDLGPAQKSLGTVVIWVCIQKDVWFVFFWIS